MTETDPETEETIISYDYYEVRLYNTPTSAAITEAVIAAMWSPSDEKKLINDYNAVVNGILEDDGYIEAYTDFLSQRKALKEQIAEDFTEWNNN